MWSVTKGPLGLCNREMAEPETVKLYLKLLREDTLADRTVLSGAAAGLGFSDDDARCLNENYLEGAFWPDHPGFAAELRAAAIDGMELSLATGKRFVHVITQLPGLTRPWVKTIELFEEVVLEFFLPAAPLDPS